MNLRFLIVVERADGSTVSRGDVFAWEVEALVARLVAHRPAKLTIVPDDGNSHGDRSPILPLDAALAWRQPDDAFTELLRRGGAR